MSIPITADLFILTASDDHVRWAAIGLLLHHCAGSVITVATRHQPDGTTVTVAEPDPAHQPDRLYGAPFGTDGRDADAAAIGYEDIYHLHIW